MTAKLRVWSILLASILFGLLVFSSVAQQRMVNPVSQLDIRTELVETPEFDVRNIQTKRGSKEWLEVRVAYDTVVEWVDELQFVFYAFVDTNMKDTPKMLLQHTVTYADIEKGRHMATVYMHPNTYERYIDDVEFVGVEIRYKGRPVRWTSDKSNMRESRWWEQARQQFPPVTGKLLSRNETPFALVGPDEYELIKRPGN